MEITIKILGNRLSYELSACFFLLSLLTVQAEVFTSTSDLVHLIDKEKHLFDVVRNYVDGELKRVKELQLILEDIKEEMPENATMESIVKYVENPVGAYSTIKRFVLMWKEFFEKMKQLRPASDIALQDYTARFYGLGLPQHLWPQDADLVGAATALLRLQKMYELPIHELAEGNIRGAKASELDAEDCYYIGNLAFESHKTWFLAADWIEESFRIQKATGVSIGENTQRAYAILTDVYLKLGKPEAAAKYSRKATEFIHGNDKNENRNPDSVTPEPPREFFGLVPSTTGMYERLCRGENVQDPKIVSKLFCQYKKTLVPIRPVKEEVLYLDPRVSMFYDVITDREDDILIELAKPQLTRSFVGDPTLQIATDYRISKLAWLFDYHLDKTVLNLSKRVEEITGLSTEYSHTFANSEAWQVLNYGIGGMYEPHHDYMEKEEMLAHLPSHLLGTGRRIATWLAYLNQVQSGGDTVFPMIKVRVPAVKNAAAFWYNLKRNGEVDPRTLHAGCPVLLGQKWISNKWIRERGQLFRRRCGLTPDALDE